jgi:hypothetical protein
MLQPAISTTMIARFLGFTCKSAAGLTTLA